MESSVRVERPLRHLLRRDWILVLLGVTLLTVLSWLYLLEISHGLVGVGLQMTMPAHQGWSGTHFVLVLAMWMVMMIAMMAPSALPYLLTYAGLQRKKGRGTPELGTASFFLGYFLAWSGYSLIAAVVQWGLHSLQISAPALTTAGPMAGGGFLILTGLFQFSRLKYSCLNQCRSPLGYFMTNWREGRWGALWMGAHHGTYCIGCCWALMGLMFVLGVMNVLWMAILAGVILIEKVFPRGIWISRLTGAVFLFWGGYAIVQLLI